MSKFKSGDRVVDNLMRGTVMGPAAMSEVSLERRYGDLVTDEPDDGSFYYIAYDQHSSTDPSTWGLSGETDLVRLDSRDDDHVVVMCLELTMPDWYTVVQALDHYKKVWREGTPLREQTDTLVSNLRLDLESGRFEVLPA